jgi:cytochrome d ubiquinol oxidase subunit II
MMGAFAHTGWLALAAAGTVAFSVLMYVLLDGTDLGVGILFIGEGDARRRELMIDTILPVWDGNETWIVLGGGGLLALFPLAYSALLTALYPVFFAMLLALILRGVAIEFREQAAERGRKWWDTVLLTGSVASAFCQGLLVGALVQGIRTIDGIYAGGRWDWLTPFTMFCGAALVAGYGWLGACWLVWRTEGELQKRARRIGVVLGAATAFSTAAVSIWTLHLNGSYARRWLADLNGAALPLAVAMFLLLAACFAVAVARRRPFAALIVALGWFVVALACMVFTLVPVILPPSMTIEAASSPPATQAFVLSGCAVLVPAILIYSTLAFWVFRGRVTSGDDGDSHRATRRRSRTQI